MIFRKRTLFNVIVLKKAIARVCKESLCPLLMVIRTALLTICKKMVSVQSIKHGRSKSIVSTDNVYDIFPTNAKHVIKAF